MSFSRKFHGGGTGNTDPIWNRLIGAVLYGEFGPGGYFANSDDFRLKLEGDMPLDGGSTHSSPFDHLGDPLDPPNNKKKVIAKVV